MCLYISQNIQAVISLNYVNTLVFIVDTDFVLCEVGAEILVGFKSLNC
jgi:hypothetical protein